MDEVEAVARKIFRTDKEFSRDRRDYPTFDDMPPSLQQWWLYRAKNKLDEVEN